MKRVFCTIIVVKMSNPIRRITLKFFSTVTCYAFQQIFVSVSPRGNVQVSKLSIRTKIVVKRVFLHNHCSDNVEPNSKDNSEIVLHCFLLRGSTDFFFLQTEFGKKKMQVDFLGKNF